MNWIHVGEDAVPNLANIIESNHSIRSDRMHKTNWEGLKFELPYCVNLQWDCQKIQCLEASLPLKEFQELKLDWPD